MPTAPRTIYLIRQVQLAVSAALQEALQEFDLTSGQYTILAIVGHRGGVSSADLARRMSVTPQSINEIVFGLERLRLVSRQEAPENRRVLPITITPAGRRLLAACDKAVDRVETDLFSSLNRRELAMLGDLLQKTLAGIRAKSRVTT